MRRAFFFLLFLALASFGRAAAQPAASAQPRVLVELYTAQGCSFCPRANMLLGQIAQDPDVLALTFPVGYWDYLGWADTMARPEFSRRQRDYSQALANRGLATPQFIFNGASQVRGSTSAPVRTMLSEVRAQGRPIGPSLTATRASRTRADFAIGAGRAPPEPADIWLAIYETGPLLVHIRAGENAGQFVTHYNVVRELRRAGTWNGAAQRLPNQLCWPRCALLVQTPNGGRILAFAAAPPPPT
jgi:hypothetical protein